jgi:hypothetical protein
VRGDDGTAARFGPWGVGGAILVLGAWEVGNLLGEPSYLSAAFGIRRGRFSWGGKDYGGLVLAGRRGGRGLDVGEG